MNAIYELFTRNAGMPHVKTVYRAAVVMGLIITAFLCWEILFRWPQFPLTASSGYGYVTQVVSSTPLWLALGSAVETTRITRRIDWASLSITPITRAQTAWALVRGSLFHHRLILAMLLSLLPAIPLGWLENRIEIAYEFANCTHNCVPPYILDSYPNSLNYSDEILKTSLIYGALGLLSWASAVAGACIGVFFGLTGRRTIFALPLAMVVTLACQTLPSFLIIFMINYTTGDMLQIQATLLSILALNIVGFGLYAATRGIVLKRYWKIPT